MTDEQLPHPTTSEIEDGYAYNEWDTAPRDEESPCRERFRSWHAAELRKAKTQALREYADDLGVDTDPYNDGEWWDGYRQAQREFVHKTSRRADQIEEDQ